MTDHAQRARALRALTCLYLQLPTSIADDVFKIVTESFEEDDRRITQAHDAGRRAGLEEAATECQQRQGFCQAVLDTADHRMMAPYELQGWHWKKDLLAALAEWCRSKAKEGT